MRWMVGIPGAWLFIEWWRSWFLTGFGWLALGYAHTDNWLGALAPVIGQYGLGLLTLMLAGALIALLLGDRRARDRALARCTSSSWGAAFALRGVEWTAALQPPDHRGRGAGRDSAGREMDRRTISIPSSSCTRRARARRTAPH